jgi:hypothetical protein
MLFGAGSDAGWRSVIVFAVLTRWTRQSTGAQRTVFMCLKFFTLVYYTCINIIYRNVYYMC